MPSKVGEGADRNASAGPSATAAPTHPAIGRSFASFSGGPERFRAPLPPDTRQSESAHILPECWLARRCGHFRKPPHRRQFRNPLSTPSIGDRNTADRRVVWRRRELRIRLFTPSDDLRVSRYAFARRNGIRMSHVQSQRWSLFVKSPLLTPRKLFPVGLNVAPGTSARHLVIFLTPCPTKCRTRTIFVFGGSSSEAWGRGREAAGETSPLISKYEYFDGEQ